MGINTNINKLINFSEITNKFKMLDYITSIINPAMDVATEQTLSDIAHRLRIHSIEATNASNSGHPTSCSSMAEIMSVLFFNQMKYDPTYPRSPANDRFILSKGHAAPILYAAWAEAGVVPVTELKKLRQMDNLLEGHPTPKLSFIDVATGSLGQGLGAAVGMAYAGKYFDKSDYRVFCLCGDGESAEGSIWEAMAFASHYKLDNLVNIIDVNRLGQSEPTMYGHHMETYEARVKAFGWHTIVVDGHDIQALVKAFNEAATIKDKPTCLLAKTHKGKFFPDVDNELNWHGKPLGPKSDAAIAAVKALIKDQTTTKLGCELLPIKAPTNKLTDNDITNLKLSVNGSTVFYPSDAVSCERAIELAANTKGVCYIRTSRPNTPVIYSNDEVFEIGKCKVVSPVSSSDICTIVAGGITLAEANKAAATLRAAGKNVRVIDVFCVKPFDWKTVLDNAKETGNKIIVVEDHYTMGGIGEVCSAELNFNAPNIAFNMKHLCVKSIPYSGKPAELLERFEIDAKAIQKAAESF